MNDDKTVSPGNIGPRLRRNFLRCRVDVDASNTETGRHSKLALVFRLRFGEVASARTKRQTNIIPFTPNAADRGQGFPDQEESNGFMSADSKRFFSSLKW